MVKIFLLIFVLIIEVVGQNGTVKTYYESGKVESRVSFIEEILEGTSYWYFENGNIKFEKNYSNGKLNGVIREFYENGLLKKEININNGILDGVLKSYYSNGGLQEVLNYERGTLLSSNNVEFDSKYIAPLSAYKAGKKKRNLDNNDFLCEIEICPEPVGGIEEIEANIIYPLLARQYKLEGSVLITAKINHRGIAEKIKVTKGLGLGCDEAAIDAVKKTKFIPGEHDGKIIATDISFKLNFKINEPKEQDNLSPSLSIQSAVLEKITNDKQVSQSRDFVNCNLAICPKPIGGIVELLNKLRYPTQAKRNKISGEVLVEASIDEFGFVTAAKVLEGIGYGCDEAARSAVIRTQFEPAKKDGKETEAVIKMIVPFILEEK